MTQPQIFYAEIFQLVHRRINPRGIFVVKMKSGKSALLYALTRHIIRKETAYSALEIAGVGKIMPVDTMGIDAEKSTAEKSSASVEVALMLISNDSFELELAWISKLKKRGAQIIAVITRSDELPDGGKALAAAGMTTINATHDAEKDMGIAELNAEIVRRLSEIDKQN